MSSIVHEDQVVDFVRAARADKAPFEIVAVPAVRWEGR